MGSECVVTKPLQYPVARRDESVVDNYHGVAISDPYRWLEDPDSDEVKDFVEKQMQVTESVLEDCNFRERLRERLTKSFEYPRYGCPFQRGNKYFYFHNPGLHPHRILYMQDSLDEEGEILLDPNGLSEDGTTALRSYEVSHDAKYLAYGVSSSGSDWLTIRVMRVDDKSVEPDELSWVKFSFISWTHDTKGFFYCRFPAPKGNENMDPGTEVNINHHHQLYYHFLGTKQSEDILCWNDLEDPTHILEARLADDGKYLLMNICKGAARLNKFYCYDLSMLPNGLKGHKGKGNLPFVKVIDNFEAYYEAIANDDTIFSFLTNKGAPRNKLVRVDLKKPSTWIEIIHESKVDVIESVLPINRYQMIVSYLSDCKHVLQIRDYESGDLLHKLPIDLGSIDYISARRQDSVFFVKLSSFLTPGVVYQYDLKTRVPNRKLLREIVIPGFNQAEYHANQVFVHSKDGTRVPVFIVAKKDIILDGSHPCLLYGYGGYGINLTPSFDTTRVVLAQHLGVVFCVANIRGGGEYGEEWHQAGSLANKQNCFDDFISVGVYLVSKGYTNPSKLCIEGGSNGGILIGACINQRPDLFGCALAHAGVMDMLRYHKFTIVLNMAEYLQLPELAVVHVSKGNLLPEGHARPQNRTTPPLSPDKGLPQKTNLQKVVEKADKDVVEAREEKERKKAKRQPVTKKRPAGGGAGGSKRRRKVLEEEIISSEDRTLDANPLNVAPPKGNTGAGGSGHAAKEGGPLEGTAENADEQSPRREDGGDGNLQDEGPNPNAEKAPSKELSIHTEHSQHKEPSVELLRTPEDEQSEGYFVPSWTLKDDVRMNSFRACREMLSHLATPAEQAALDELNNQQLLRQAYVNVGSGIALHAELLKRFNDLNSAYRELEETHAGCSSLTERLHKAEDERNKNMSKFQNLYKEFRELEGELSAAATRSDGMAEQLEELQKENAELTSLSESKDKRIQELEQQLKGKAEEVDRLSQENYHRTTELASSEMVRRNTVKELLPAVFRRLFSSAEYKRNLGRVYSLTYAGGFINGIRAGRKEEEAAAVLAQYKNLNLDAPKLWQPEFDKLFEAEYPYVKKLSESYGLPLGDLMNLFPEVPPPKPVQTAEHPPVPPKDQNPEDAASTSKAAK